MVGPFLAVEEGSSAQAYLHGVQNYKNEVETFLETQDIVTKIFGKGLTFEHHYPNSWAKHIDWINPLSISSSAAQLGTLPYMPSPPKIPADVEADLNQMSEIQAQGERSE